MSKKETAEQKLLKMIEASSAKKAAPQQGQKSKKAIKKSVTLAAILNYANIVLIIAVIAAVLFLVSVLSIGLKLVKGQAQFTVPSNMNKRQFNVEELMPKMENINYYLSGVLKRNIFFPHEEVSTPANIVAKNLDSEIIKKTKSLRLVGVSWLDKVETASVMIEDAERKQTYFLRKGDKIGGDIFVKTIYADSAVLGYQNEEIIIKYDKPQI